MSAPRVALFTDCYHDVSGIALTSRHLLAFARSHGLPLLCVRSGSERRFTRDGSTSILELLRGAVSIPLERGLGFDALLWRHQRRSAEILEVFRPDVVHVTGPGDFGLLGAYLAKKRGIPLVASWHTNLHQFARQRLERLLSAVPRRWVDPLTQRSEACTLRLSLYFYGLANLVLAPNDELSGWLQRELRLRTEVMGRGVDAELFHPRKRRRTDDDSVLRLGFVGRLSPEKNLTAFAGLERYLLERGAPPFRFVIVGDGGERAWLERNLRHAEFRGVLAGEELAREFADFDLLVFPSHTDTYGNAVQEALASGVPSIVTSSGGPKHVVDDGETGLVGRDDEGFREAVLFLMRNRECRLRMASAAREVAGRRSWDRVFERVYDHYRDLRAGRDLFAHGLLGTSSLPPGSDDVRA